MNWITLRKKYPNFIYRSFSWKMVPKGLKIWFDFEIGSLIKLKPEILIEGISKTEIKKLGKKTLDNLVFNLGMIEMLSYWKATASPKIEVLAGFLGKEQIKWWKDLILNGMGQFFFENKINFRTKNFLKIVARAKKEKFKPSKLRNLKNRFLVPVGGGKDSIVTIEYLKKMKRNLVLFCLNPQKSQKKIIEISGIKEKIFAKRKIDKNLLKLNQRGFLNGHTPFTAYLSFLSVLIAALKDCKFVVFSNEKSANEGNLRYLGKTINHQYSKSEIFEKKFRLYIKKYLIENLQYFSLLRALNESEVVKLFIQFPQYFMVFSSCNSQFKIENKIKERWCKNCPKCLFIFTTLYSLLGKKTVLKIFKTNLFENKTLRETMLQLVGKKKFKPFECVGTIKENKKIFEKALERWQKEEKKLPYLLSIFAKIKNGN